MTDLFTIPAEAATLIRERGWVQEDYESPDGSLCLHGAIQACTPQKGDAEIVRALARTQGFTEKWNDDPARTESEVLDALSRINTSDEALAAAFGPQWEAIVALIHRDATLTENEAEGLTAARDVAGAAAWGAVWSATRDAAWGSARRVLRDAALALTVRDLIGQYGFTQDHYDTLTAPWSAVIGPAHPDDTPKRRSTQ